jgi:methyl-accepting chemotaxis protein
MVDITRDNDDGFVDYMWPKPGRTELAPKLSYVRIFRPLGWIVGTGIYIDHIDAARAQRELQNSAQVRQTIFTVVTVGAVLLLLSSVVFYIFAAALTKPLVRVTGIAAKIAEGDLEIEKIRLRSKDETAILTESFMRMIEVLREKAKAIEKIASGDLTVDIHTISEKDKLGMSLTLMKESLNEILNLVNDAVDQVFLGSDQISLSSQSLAQGATQQASSLQEIGETLAGINSRSRKNAEHAAEASAYAGNTSETAASGNMKMGELTDTMARIVASSDEINKVVKVIDDIAFQINLLALNANVEAARAGKYGKGFAVVADEVRNLANRSAEAVKETSSMVEQTISGIRDGNRVVKETAVHFQDIVTGIEKVTAFIEEIDNASREQAEGIEQITEAVEQIEKVTESNTAGAEETAAATESLAKQAKQLREMLSRFRLESGGKTGYLPAPEEPDNWE